ncbi:MAG: N-6 DNA methylase [Pseudonocardiaceae bacterium]
MECTQPVTMAEIAELARVRRPTVSNWRRRHTNFPRPCRDVGTQPQFDPGEIAAWLDRRPMLDDSNGDAQTYGDVFRTSLALRVLSRSHGIGANEIRLGVALAALRVVAAQELPSEAATVAELAIDIERQRPELAGLFTAELTEDDPIDRLALRVESLTVSVGSAELAEALLRTADDVDSELRTTQTPAAVAELVARLAGDVSGLRVTDIAVGAGNLLLRVLNGKPAASVRAVDADGTVLRLLRHRCLCHGVDVLPVEADSLRLPVEQEADLVLLDPPFISGEFDPGQKPEPVGPWAWVQRAARELAPGGRAYVVVPAWALARPDQAREAALAERLLRTVIQLPHRIHSFRTGAEFALLEVVPCEEAPEAVVLCNADRIATGDGWPSRVAELVADTDHARPEICRVVHLDELRGRTLLPAHVLTPAGDPVEHFTELTAARRALAPDAPWIDDLAIVQPDDRVEHLHVGHLVRTGQLRLLAGHRIAAGDLSADGIRVVGAEELRGERPDEIRAIDPLVLAGYRAEPTRVGDVVVLAEGGIRAVPADELDLPVALHPARILRISQYQANEEATQRGEAPKPLWMRARVLAWLLTAPRNAARQSGSLVRRVDLRSLELPVLTSDEVALLDEFLTALHRQRGELIERLAALNRLDAAVLAGFADGALRVAGGNTRSDRDDERDEPDAGEE